MSFFKLYEYATAQADNALGDPADAGRPQPMPANRAPVEVRDLQKTIISLEVVKEIKVHAVILDPEINLGHIKIEDRREDRYDDPDLYADIRFHEDQTRCWVRFVVCKELMHTFDAEDERVFDPERFRILLQQLETPPVAGQESPVLTSEWDAEWMALLVLCPYEHRNKWKALLDADMVSDMEVAEQFRIPKLVIAALVSDQYDEAYELLYVKAREAADGFAAVDPNEPIPAA